MSPEAVSVSLPRMLIHGTWKPGWVTNECVLDELAAERPPAKPSPSPPAAAGSADPVTVAGQATENEKLTCFFPGAPEAVPAVADRNVAVTETCSPGENGRSGENAVPWPAG